MVTLVVIVLAVAFIINISCGAATTYHFKKMGNEAFERGNKNRDKLLRENAKKANIYYNSVGHYYEHDRNYDGTMKE